MVKTAKDPAEYILPLYMNGLSGRMLRLPAPPSKKREILLLAGQHTSIERMIGVAEYLNRYGSVTIPDFPGFGGMQSFYKIGEKPSLDNFADYLAAFVKLRYRNKRLTIMAVSFAFPVVTRMLQRYPELSDKVDLLISVSGMVNKKDFRWKRRYRFLFKTLCRILSNYFVSSIGSFIFLRKPVVRFVYRVVERNHPKIKGSDEEERKRRIAFEAELWKINDIRTHAATGLVLLTLNHKRQHIGLPVYHLAIDNDRYFNHVLVEEHMREIFKDFKLIKMKVPAHAPTVIASAKEASYYVPLQIKELLRKKAN